MQGILHRDAKTFLYALATTSSWGALKQVTILKRLEKTHNILWRHVYKMEAGGKAVGK